MPFIICLLISLLLHAHLFQIRTSFNSMVDLRADLHTGGVFRYFHNEGLILEFFHLIISYPKISRENQFWHYRALKNNRKVLMSRFDEGPSFDDAQFFSTDQSQSRKIRDEITFLFFPFLMIHYILSFFHRRCRIEKNEKRDL